MSSRREAMVVGCKGETGALCVKDLKWMTLLVIGVIV